MILPLGSPGGNFAGRSGRPSRDEIDHSWICHARGQRLGGPWPWRPDGSSPHTKSGWGKGARLLGANRFAPTTIGPRPMTCFRCRQCFPRSQVCPGLAQPGRSALRASGVGGRPLFDIMAGGPATRTQRMPGPEPHPFRIRRATPAQQATATAMLPNIHRSG